MLALESVLVNKLVLLVNFTASSADLPKVRIQRDVVHAHPPAPKFLVD